MDLPATDIEGAAMQSSSSDGDRGIDGSSSANNGIFRTPQDRYQLLLSCLMAFAQNFTAANAVLYYSTTLFAKTDLSSDSVAAASVLVGVAKFVGVIGSLLLVERAGRRGLLLFGTCAMIFCHFLIAVAFIGYLESEETGVVLQPGNGALTVFAVSAFVVFWDLSWAPLMWVVCSEVLPETGRAVGMGLSVACFWIGR